MDTDTYIVIGTFFSGIATILTGIVALIVYSSQKRDKKINAARIILSEIRKAEKGIEDIPPLLGILGSDLPSVLPTNSWSKQSYLFASDFDQDELEELNSFYGFCEQIEDAVKKDNNFFWVTTEQRAKLVQSTLVELIEKSMNSNFKINPTKLTNLKQSILDTFTNDVYSYSPQKTRTQLTNDISKVKKITTTTTGAKLKKIAKAKYN